MLFSSDLMVLLLIVLILAVSGVVRLRRWFHPKPDLTMPEMPQGSRIHGEGAELLAEHGYEVFHGKRKIGIDVYVDDEKLGSSLFVDYYARKGEDYYVVKLVKSRKPIDMAAGSAIREQLLPYALLYEHTAGVLYVDTDHRKIYKIRFELEL